MEYTYQRRFNIALLPSVRKFYKAELPNISWEELNKDEFLHYQRIEHKLKAIIESPSKGISWITQTIKRKARRVGILIVHSISDIEIYGAVSKIYPKIEVKNYTTMRSAIDGVATGKVGILHSDRVIDESELERVDYFYVRSSAALDTLLKFGQDITAPLNIENNIRLSLLEDYKHPKELIWALKLNALYKLELGRDLALDDCDADLKFKRQIYWSVKKTDFSRKYIVGETINKEDQVLALPLDDLTREELEIQQSLLRKVRSTNIKRVNSTQVTVLMKVHPTTDQELQELLGQQSTTFSVITIDAKIEERTYTKIEFVELIHPRIIDVDTHGQLLITLLEMFGLQVEVIKILPLRYPLFVYRRETLDRLRQSPDMIYFTAPKGSGKTMIGRMFSRVGYRVLDSDAWGRILKVMFDADIDYEAATRKYFSMTGEERSMLVSYFEAMMLKIVDELGTPDLRKESQYVRGFNKVYSAVIKEYPPNIVHKYFATATIIEDDLGVNHMGMSNNKTIIFGHNYVEVRQAMGGSLIRLIPMVLSPFAILRRIRNEIYKFAELMLYSAYLQVDSNNLPGLQIGWITKAIDEMEKEKVVFERSELT